MKEKSYRKIHFATSQEYGKKWGKKVRIGKFRSRYLTQNKNGKTSKINKKKKRGKRIFLS